MKVIGRSFINCMHVILLADGVFTRKSEQIQAAAREMPVDPKKHLSS